MDNGVAETNDSVVTIEQLKKQFEEFESATSEAREYSELVRDHRDLKPWTAEELEEFQRRKQAPLVIPKIASKVDFLVGLERQQRSDPRAYPRTQKHEDAADAATDAIRYVADNTEFNEIASCVFEQAMLVEGYSAVIIEPEIRRNKVEVVVNWIPFDRFYYDPYSRNRFFSDANYMGIVLWMDLSEAQQRYPDKKEEISLLMVHGEERYDTFSDKPRWIDNRRKRVKVLQHYFIQDGVWHEVVFTDGAFLKEAAPCSLVDEYGEPQCPIEAVHGYIDRENNRYGLCHSMVSLEKEINQRRSKSLHLLNTMQVHYEQGAVSNPRRIANDLKKPDGAIEFPAGTLSEGRIQIHRNTEMAAGQVQLLQEAKAELDQRGASNILQGINELELSGKAIRNLQNNSQMEMGPLLDGFRNWKRRCYRQMWNRIKQFWDEERWIRVTDDEDNLKWVGLNRPITVGQALKEKAQQGDQRAQAALQEMIAIQDPRLNQQYEVQNNVAEIDVDIIIDESQDLITVQQEQFDVITELAKIYGPQEVPFEAIMKLSSLRNKDDIIDLLKGDPRQQQQIAALQAQQQQIQEILQQLEIQKRQAEIAVKQNQAADIAAKTERTRLESEQTVIENAIVANFPDLKPNVNI